MIREVSLCVLVMVGVVLGQNSQQFNCPQPDGQFELPGDCTQFYQCDGGVATLSSCPADKIFNPQVGYCDWPHNAPNLGCASQGQGDSLCSKNPCGSDLNDEPFFVAHPIICNAYYACTSTNSNATCQFCGEGQYFYPVGCNCRVLPTGQDLCDGKVLVNEADKVSYVQDGTCPSSI